MDADIACLEGNDNKENIPISSDPVLQDCKLLSSPTTTGSRKFKRKFRLPLRDITNSFTVAQPDLGLNSVPNSSSSAALNCRKRKAFASTAIDVDDDDDIDSKYKVSSKILRKGFR